MKGFLDMTWFPVAVGAASERDAVLGVHPEAYARHRTFLDACDAALDPDVRRLCRARMAQLLRCREELASHDPEWLERLRSWDQSPEFTDVQRAVLAFVEQFVLDASLVTRELAAPLEREFGTSGVIDFVNVVAAYEASLRLSTLLDLEPVG